MDSSQVVFYTIISDSHYQGCRTNEFIASFRHFHPDIKLVVFGQADIDREFSENPKLTFYNCKAHFAKLLYNDYKLVVNIDADHLILGRLVSILFGDYQVACPMNYNILANASLKVGNSELVSEKEYFQGGLIASTSIEFWNLYDKISIEQSHKFPHSENDVLNIISKTSKFTFTYLDNYHETPDAEIVEYYGCASLGREKDFYSLVDAILVDAREVKAYHFAWGGINKRHPKHLFSKEVTDFIYTNIINNKSMAQLKRIDKTIVDLSVSDKFMEHYGKKDTYAKYIIDNEINPGLWYDSLLETIHKDAVIVDCGANVGMFSVYMDNGSRKFYCVEPTPSHVEVAKDLFAKLGTKNEIFEGVVWNKNGSVKLFEEPSNSTMNRIASTAELEEIGTKALTLKSLLEHWKLENVGLLKLDIESAEQKVIMEDETIGDALKKCAVVLIEVHPQDGFGNKVDVEGIINKMKSFGFIHKEGGKSLAHYFYQLP